MVKVGSGNSVTVFNISGNKYRLIVAIHYNTQRVYVLRLFTHADYDKLLETQLMRQTATKSRNRARRGHTDRANSDYLGLIAAFPLRALHDDKDYDAALQVLDALALRPEGSLSAGEQDYFDALTILVEAYDREVQELDSGRREPLPMLKYAMQESGMTQADLGRLLGNRALASLILRGRRQLSKTHLRILAHHFNVSPALFLGA